MEIVVIIQDCLAHFVFLHVVEDRLTVDDGFIKVDDHIAIHTSGGITTAIDVTTRQTAIQVIGSTDIICRQVCRRCDLITIFINGVPYKFCFHLTRCLPPHRF